MTKDELKEYLQTHFGDKLSPLDTGRYDPMYQVKRDDLLEVARALKEDENLQFDFLSNLKIRRRLNL